MASKIEVNQFDNNIKLIFTIKKDSRVESLYGAMVYFKMKEKNTETVLIRECSITDANAAECMYILTREDTAISGSYITELEIIYSNQTEISINNPVIIIVKPELISRPI